MREVQLRTVTVVVTDVESSTGLWASDPVAAAKAVQRMHESVDRCVWRHDGIRRVEQDGGDSTVSIFPTAASAVQAALAIQLELTTSQAPDNPPIVARVAVHAGSAEVGTAGSWADATVVRCQRLNELGRGGDVLLSASAAALLLDEVPAGASVVDLGEHRLRDLARHERVWRLNYPGSRSSGPLRTTSRGQHTNLRPMPTQLVGRDRELADLAALLGTTRALTLTGPGGVGKTRLAHALASSCFERSARPTWWVDLAALAEPGAVAAEVAATVGLPPNPAEHPLDALASWLGDEPTLIVLDNCEHVIDGAAPLAEAVIGRCGNVTVLTTSREPLGLRGEVTWRTPSLSVPHHPAATVAEARRYPAVELLCRRARAADPDLRFDDALAPVLADVCRRLDGLPLAIELAAARLRSMSLPELSASLHERFSALTGGARTALPRQRTMEASVAWSYDLLDTTASALFRRLAVFAAPFTLPAARGVCAGDPIDDAEVGDLLSGLVDQSLVEHDLGRYRMLETIRVFAANQAAEAGELPTWRDRHLHWCVLNASTYRVTAHMTEAAFAEGVSLLPDLRSALDWSVSPGRQPALELVPVIASLQDWSARHAENRALAAALSARFSDDEPRLTEALAGLLNAPYYAGDEMTLAAQRRALATARGTDRARLLLGTGELELFDGTADGERAMHEAIALAESCDSPDDAMAANLSLSYFLSVSGRLRQAHPLVDRLERHAGPGDGPFRAGIQTARGLIMVETSIDAAARLFRDSIRRLGGHPSPRSGLVICALWALDPALAAEALGGDRWASVGGAYGPIAGLARAVPAIVAGELTAARASLAEAIQGWTMGNVASWLRLLDADLAARLGDDDHARGTVASVAEAIKGKDLPYLHSLVLTALSGFALADGQPRRALQLAHDGLALARANDSSLMTTDALESIAAAGHVLGRTEAAARLLAATQSQRARSGYRWQWGPLHTSSAAILQLPAASRPYRECSGMSLADAVALATRARGDRSRPAQGWEALTPTELDVARRAAAGATNREIAAELFVSVATVKTHLVRVYDKLSVRSRTELAARIGAFTGDER